MVDRFKIFIEERFLLFDNFTKKNGIDIASCVLKNLKYLSLKFQNCIGQAYDNGASMAGTQKGAQALLQEVNSSCLFSLCGNHTLNLVGCDCAESCKEAITYFGTIQEMNNLCSTSPQRWEILKTHTSVSLHSMSRTRWSSRIDSVKLVAQHLHAMKNPLKEMESLNLTADARNQLQSI